MKKKKVSVYFLDFDLNLQVVIEIPSIAEGNFLLFLCLTHIYSHIRVEEDVLFLAEKYASRYESRIFFLIKKYAKYSPHGYKYKSEN